MPLTVLVALFVAFWLPIPSDPRPLSPSEATDRALAVLVGLALVGGAAALIGRSVARRVARQGTATVAVRKWFGRGVRGVDVLTLAFFGLTIHQAEWPR